jgi:epoxyqueuosine reductase
VLIAIGNSGDSKLARFAEARLADESPLVRAMAVWALSKLLPHDMFDRLASQHLPSETDAAVAAEWRLVLLHV